MSRAKDANKSSKKKDSSNSSQNQGSLGIHQNQQSSSPNHGTPTSSTTSVNDTKAKSPDNTSQGYASGNPPPHYIPQGGNVAGQPVNNGPSTPTKQGQQSPSVIISPSAPVGLANATPIVVYILIDLASLACSPSWCRRDNAGGFGSPTEVSRLRSSSNDSQGHVGGDPDTKTSALLTI